MPKTIRIFLFAVGGLVGIALLALFAAMFFFDIDSCKARVEAAASKAMRMEVTVDGPMGYGIFPGLHLTLENVHIRNRGTEIAFLKEADIAVQLLPLLRQEIRYDHIATSNARIAVERDRDGHYNYQLPPLPAGSGHPLDLPKISFADLTVTYADKQTGGSFETTTCNGELIDMRHPGGAPFLRRLSVTGQFTCAEVHGKTRSIADLDFSVKATDGVFDFRPITMHAYGGRASATMRMDRSIDVPTFDITYQLSKFRIEQYFKPQPSGKSVRGAMDFATRLSMRGRTRALMRQSAKGEMSLSGNNLTLTGMDLDKSLAKFESSQDFNLLDLGAFLFAGPVGLVVTKGYEFSALAQQGGGSTPIRTVVSRWKVEKGVAQATDVALTTPEHRLALQGGLDFVDDKYQDVVIALVNAEGCAMAKQKISGPFNKPAADRSTLLVPIGPLLKLLDRAKALAGGKCEVFYAGSLPPPKP